MIPVSLPADQSPLAFALSTDKVVKRYRAFFSLFDWSIVEQWERRRSSRGRPAHPEAAYLKAFLIRINEGFIYTTQLRAYLYCAIETHDEENQCPGGRDVAAVVLPTALLKRLLMSGDFAGDNTFVQMLRYKCLLYGKELCLLDERNTSKQCGGCGH